MNRHPLRDAIRFRTPEALQEYLEGIKEEGFLFRARPISGRPETFLFNGREKVVTRERDQSTFDSMDDFLCYAFQCDREGYSHTEYVDIEVLP
ncbi:MAG: hypothetical protein K6T80_02280 [Firmicutes bacterium]|nr:hypothetical protein [Bacillota bacterium]